MASTVLGNRDASEHKKDENNYPSRAYNRVEESDNKHNKDVNYILCESDKHYGKKRAGYMLGRAAILNRTVCLGRPH